MDVMQLELTKVRVTWNPDDNRFYVELLMAGGDWETLRVFRRRAEAIRLAQKMQKAQEA